MSGLNSRFIWNARYFHIAKANEKLSKFAVSGEYASGLVEYVGTRETVALNFTDEVKDRPATEKQINLIKDLCRSVPNYKNTLEYEDYEKAPTMKNASELIAMLSEEVMMHGEFNEAANLVEYAAKRPGAVKVGSHGLFSFDDNVDLEKAQEEVATHEGNIWTHVLSLRREDADKLGYDNQASWKALVKSNLAIIAEAHHIKLSNLRWYGAMHDTGYHPHIHLFVFSKNPQEGYFSNKGKIDYLEKCKRAFATKIFAADLETEYQAKTEFREELKNSTKEILDKLTENPLGGYSEDIQKALVKKLTTLSESVSPAKEVKYGYLKAELKELVNDIQKTLVYENKHLSELYMKWCKHQFNIEKIYVSEPTEVPIEDNKEFIPIKNYIIKVAQGLRSDLVIDNNTYDIDNSDDLKNTDESVIKHFDTYYRQNDVDYQEVSNDTHSFDFKNDEFGDIESKAESFETTNYLTSFYTEENLFPQDNLKQSDKERFKELESKSSLASRDGYICCKLADCYYYGKGTERDLYKAMMWYGIATDQYHNGIASYRLGKIYSDSNNSDFNSSLSKEYFLKAYLNFRDGIKNSELFLDIEEGKQLKDYKLEMNVSKHEAYKEFLIGCMYFEGNGIEQDYYKAYQSFYLSSIHGNDNATFYIGKMLIEELGVDKDFEEGIAYLTSAAKSGNSQAAYYLYRHFKKENTAESKVFAQHYLKNAASNKHPIAQIALAKDEYKQGNIAKSIELLNEATENNIADAYYFLGEIYNNSKLSEFFNPDTAYNNFTKAFKLYIRDFNDKPDGHIAYRIAKMYHKGLGVTQNIDEALKWYHISSDLENAPASYSLYKYYRDNDTLDNHKVTAISFLYLASEREHPTAQLKVAKLEYKQGNISKAVEIFKKVADKGIADAQYYLGETHSNLSLSEYYNPELSQSYYASALKTYIADFKSDDAHSFSDESKGFLAYNIAKMYQEGLGTEKVLDEAVKWYRISSDLDNAPASFSLYKYYKENDALENHNDIANEFLKLSAERGYSVAKLKVGQLEYEQGNVNGAIELFNSVAEKNVADGYYRLGEIYSNSELSEFHNLELSNLNFAKALDIYIEDFNSEPNGHTALRIARMYQDGLGTEQNNSESVKWHDIATAHGNASSAYILYKHYKESDSLLSEHYLRTASSLKHPFAQIKVAKLEHQKGNISEAINLLKQTLDKEIADTYYYLGHIYNDSSLGTYFNSKLAYDNFSTALKMFIDDFENSHADSIGDESKGFLAYNIAKMYQEGLGTEKNLDEAVKWYRISSDLDNAPASYSLYKYYKENNTLINHNVIANQFLQLSAERGYSVAQLKVGQLEYEQGNVSRAIELFNSVAEKNVADGYYRLGEIYSNSELSEFHNLELSNLNFAKALNIYIEDFNREPNGHTAFRIARMYQDGLGTEQNNSESVKWHDIATTHGNASSAYILYKHYKESNSLLSEHYLRTASSLKHPFAQVKVAKIEHLNGNVDTAINLLNNTLDKEIADAYYYLGRIYNDDRFTYRYNPDLARTNFLRAFDLYVRDFNENPNGHIAYQIARMYHHGYGVEKNGAEAIRWYKIASQYDGNNYDKEIEMASQQVSLPLGMLASTVLHIGKVFSNNTLNTNKKRYTPDKKVARQEKERKLRAGQAQNDSDTYDYNY